MSELDRWAELLAEAAIEIARQPERICDLCVRGLGVSGAGISMVTTTGNRGVVCATDDRAARIEELQMTTGVGPCMDAVRARSPVLIGDLAHPDGVDVSQWASLASELSEAGVQAVFAFPLQIGAITVGALDLYRDSVGTLEPPELRGALLAADAAALALLYLNVDGDGDEDFVPDAGIRADYRLQIHQAAGMVSVQLDVPVEEAMVRMRARAFATGQSLTDVAEDIVNRRVRFTSEDT